MIMNSKQAFAALALLIVACSVAGCSANSISSIAKMLPTTCPLPPALSDDELKKVLSFSEDVNKMVESTAGAQLAGEVEAKVKAYYPAAETANRIYALGHAACIACRTSASNVQACGQTFAQLVKALAPAMRGEEEAPDVKVAHSYSDSRLSGILPSE